MTKKFILIVFLIILLATGCKNVVEKPATPVTEKSPEPVATEVTEEPAGSPTAEHTEEPVDVKPTVIEEEDKSIIDSNVDFAFNLYKKLSKEKDGNLCISPLSIYLSLSMVYNGTEGDTKKAIEKTIGLQGFEPDRVNRDNEQLMKNIKNPDKQVELYIANSIWNRDDVELKPEFIETGKKYYEAEVRAGLDKEVINNWVEENTGGKISGIIDEINPTMAVIFLNAIYFKGEWLEKFDKENTKDGIFYLSNKDKYEMEKKGIKKETDIPPNVKYKKIPMMSQMREFYCLGNEKIQLVELPYKGWKMSMYIILPVNGYTLEELEEDLNKENWKKWTDRSELWDGGGILSVPRFTLNYSKELNNTLKELGMGKAFEISQDFSPTGSFPAGLEIVEVNHAAFIEVNEDGTEATAVTDAEGCEGVVMPFDMIVDAPFFFAIKDNETGLILFMGSVVNP